MARILASLFWGVSAFTFGSDWAYLSGNETHSLYIDLASIRLTGSIESAWFGHEYRPAQSGEQGEPPHAGSRNKVEVDCSKNLIRSNALYFYDAMGNVVSSTVVPTAWTEPIPDSTGDQMATALCRTKRSVLGTGRIQGTTPDKFQDFMYRQRHEASLPARDVRSD